MCAPQTLLPLDVLLPGCRRYSSPFSSLPWECGWSSTEAVSPELPLREQQAGWGEVTRRTDQNGELSAKGKQVSPDFWGAGSGGWDRALQPERVKGLWAGLGEPSKELEKKKNKCLLIFRPYIQFLIGLTFSPESEWAAGGKPLKGRRTSSKEANVVNHDLRNGTTFWGLGLGGVGGCSPELWMPARSSKTSLLFKSLF